MLLSRLVLAETRAVLDCFGDSGCAAWPGRRQQHRVQVLCASRGGLIATLTGECRSARSAWR
eukprot:13861988-Alexandrium_andersonii.AAC.1